MRKNCTCLYVFLLAAAAWLWSGGAGRSTAGEESELGLSLEDILEDSGASTDLGIFSAELADDLEEQQKAAEAMSSELLEEQRAARRARGWKPADPAEPLPVDPAALRRALADLACTWGDEYPRGAEYLARLERLTAATDQQPAETQAALQALQREALLANPLLAFDRLLFVRRHGRHHGLPQNWQGNCSLRRSGFDNEIATLSPVAPDGQIATIYRPTNNVFVGDVDLHFGGRRMLFSSIGSHNRWQVFEIGTDGSGLRQVTTDEHSDIDNYDACYLPNGQIVFASTAPLQGIPCVGGRDQVANLYLMNPDGTGMRQLCFDQDHNWCPTVMNDGRVMFTRWEYSDTPHYFTRLLMRMNPDGTGQMACYGSNSYWPNSLFYARPIPGSHSRVVGIVSGHHGVPRMGELVLFDTAMGQHEANGAVQRIPGFGRPVEPVIRDRLVDASWPRFLHPFPLAEPGTGRGAGKYFLVSCQPANGDPWGIYLADIFDNIVKLIEDPACVLLEPIPLRPTVRPPVMPERVRLREKFATVYLADVYAGPGLKGVPRGTVKRLRIFSFDYGYQGLANHTYIGIDGPWDVHRILGTVPVEPDGSALFRVPANTPIALQPLDARGRAVQLMRSWFTAMPGEQISCVGCHESLSEVPPPRSIAASYRKPADIEPWYGPARGFSFEREVQPVVDHYCIQCHDGQHRHSGKPIPDLRAPSPRERGFSPAYRCLHRFVRRPGPESDYRLLPPCEYHASTSELIQMLQKGHHGLTLDGEGMERLVAWIDLNVPYYGTWGDFRPIPRDQRERRRRFRERYAGIAEDYEIIPDIEVTLPPAPELQPPSGKAPAAKAQPEWLRAVADAEAPVDQPRGWQTVSIEVGRTEAGQPVAIDFVRIPAGSFTIGEDDGCADEGPRSRLDIEHAFWMSRCEIQNAVYACFDPAHDSRYLNRAGKDQSNRGVPMNGPQQPAVRVSWDSAMAFCRWLSRRSGRRITLPTEAQWEYACRAGSDTDFWYGDAPEAFTRRANVADSSMAGFRGRSAKAWPPGASAKDGSLATRGVGAYDPNPWGLWDMHGNAAEWTRTTYRPYPYDAADGRDDPENGGAKVVRGGSFYDRPKRCRSAFRLAYPPWQRVFNVGFRVVIADRH